MFSNSHDKNRVPGSGTTERSVQKDRKLTRVARERLPEYPSSPCKIKIIRMFHFPQKDSLIASSGKDSNNKLM